MHVAEALRFSLDALRANKIRTFLTALGLVIGNASVILVVTISLTSRDYILDQIRAIGSNLVYAYYEAGNNTAMKVEADFVKLADVEAVRAQLGSRIVAATGVMINYDRLYMNGRAEDIAVIGTFRERTSTFGLSELSTETALIPITVIRYFNPVERIDPMYVQSRTPADVEPVAREVKRILQQRHRPGARYKVETLTAILDAAKKIALILTIVLVLVSAIALIISGIGIMNIMLVTVTERTREIGVRMAIGASRHEVLQQFLLEAVVISIGGGLIGILFGLAGPLAVNFFVEGIRSPISSLSVAIAFGVSFIVGLVFGLLPANRASRLNPTEALRYE